MEPVELLQFVRRPVDVRMAIRKESASKIEDVNGNYLSMQAGGGGSTQFTDTLGRSVTLSWAGAGPALTSFTYKDSNGQTQTISLAYSTVNVNPGFTHPVSGVTGAPMNATLLSTITLPNNLTYAFQYNTYGEITRMTYPTGGYTRYEYQMGQIPYSCNSPSSCAIPN